VLLLGGGLYVFFAGMARIQWDFGAMLGSGQSARLFTPADHEVPWTALVILMLSTNVWYYATNQYINQRCLAARNEWHAKMGVLFSAGLQLLIPLATCFPGMIYRVLNPALADPDAAYPMVVAAVVPPGLRGLVVAAILSAIMSTISGLVNSTSTMVTLDLVQRRRGLAWSEERLVRVGRWSGAIALLIGALFAPLVMKWENIFRYAQDIWAPMAAPIVVVFLAGALWPGATDRGALACLWLAVFSVPVVLAKAILADAGVHFLPPNLENPMVLGGAVALVALVLMVGLGGDSRWSGRGPAMAVAVLLILWLAAVSPEAIALLVLGVSASTVLPLLITRRTGASNLWDQTMLRTPGGQAWYARLGLWWTVLAAILVGIYVKFW
jgi:SSS family solute:Na+ symporter